MMRYVYARITEPGKFNIFDLLGDSIYCDTAIQLAKKDVENELNNGHIVSFAVCEVEELPNGTVTIMPVYIVENITHIDVSFWPNNA